MEWTEKDRELLLHFKDSVDSENIRIKEVIKHWLIRNRFLIHVIENKELEDSGAEPDEYFGVNIYPYYMIPDTQTDAKVIICFETHTTELARYNKSQKIQQTIFTVLVHKDVAIHEETGIPRHDLLALLIQDMFNYSFELGEIVSDKGAITDNNYATRTLTFEKYTDNNITKSKVLPIGVKAVIANKIDIHPKISETGV